MASHRTKLLITLVLFMAAVAVIWTPAQSEARSLSSVASGQLSIARPGATPASGDPDIGQGAAPPPAPSLKQAHLHLGGESVKSRALSEWVLRAGRIWATLYLRVFG